MKLENASKFTKLALSLIFDALGFVSLIFPPFDFVWAPLAGYLMTKLYKGKTGKIAGIIVFVEEALPWLDVVPTFTLMWIYSFVINPEKKVIKSN